MGKSKGQTSQVSLGLRKWFLSSLPFAWLGAATCLHRRNNGRVARSWQQACFPPLVCIQESPSPLSLPLLPLPTAQTSLFMLPIYILFWALQPVSLPENLKLAHYGHMGQKHPPLLLTQSWTWDYSSSSSTISSCSSPFSSIMFLLPSLLLLLLLSHPVTCGHTRSFLGSVRIPLHGKLDPSIARIWAVPQVPRATAWGVALPDLPDASLLPKVPLSEEQEPLH